MTLRWFILVVAIAWAVPPATASGLVEAVRETGAHLFGQPDDDRDHEPTPNDRPDPGQTDDGPPELRRAHDCVAWAFRSPPCPCPARSVL